MNQKMLVAVLAAIISFAVTAPSSAGGFDDVPRNHWAYNAVQYLYHKGVLEGDDWGKFNGDDTMTRYEFAVGVARIVQLIDEIDAAGGYDVGGELEAMTDDIYAIVDELADEFESEIESIRATLAVHSSKIGTLEEDVQELKGTTDEIYSTVSGLGKIKWKGDFRARFEGKYKSDDSQVQRPRIRFRLSIDAPLNNQVKFKGRLVRGSSASPTSTNQTIEDEFEKRPIWIDRAYLVYEPEGLADWEFIAGKFSPNWENTLITIDSDVNVEGIGQSFANEDGFVVNFAELVPDEKGFYIIGQVGKEDLLTEGLDAYVTYHYINDEAWQFIEQKLMDGDLKNRFQFNRIDMDHYSAIDVIGRYAFDTGGTPLTLTGNYVLNLADDAVDDASGLQQGAWAQLKIGKAKELGDVEGWIEYGKLQANSVLTFLTDADRGSSDHQWYGGGIKYKWMKNLDIGFTFIYADRLSKDEDYKLIQVDFLSKFS